MIRYYNMINYILYYIILYYRGDTICDIGAHIGSYTVPLAAAIGAEGTVL